MIEQCRQKDAFAQAPGTPQAIQTEIDQLRSDFNALKQQYGDRLSALEAKLAAIGGTAPAQSVAQPPAAGQPPTAQVPVTMPAPTAQIPVTAPRAAAELDATAIADEVAEAIKRAFAGMSTGRST